MRGQRFRFRRQVGRAASLVAALVAVLMLIAGGATHRMLHADEGGPPAASALMSVAALGKASTSTDHKDLGGLPHSCSGHCSAHSADQPPLLVLVSAPAPTTAGWELDLGRASGFHPSGGPERPPRV